MYYAAIKTLDIANGPGLRTTLFVSGCTRRCKECFQPQTWDFDYGQPFTPEVRQQLLDSLAPEHIAGLTLLGGEPFEPQNQPEVAELFTAQTSQEVYNEQSIEAINSRNEWGSATIDRLILTHDAQGKVTAAHIKHRAFIGSVLNSFKPDRRQTD